MVLERAKSLASFNERCRTLDLAAHAVRQQAVQRGSDLYGWQLSRLMRDADTDSLVNMAELKYGVWLQTNHELFLAKKEAAN
jgi:hypothetical protein